MASRASALAAIYGSYGDSIQGIEENDELDTVGKELLSKQALMQMIDMVSSLISNTIKSEGDTFSNIARNI